MHYLVSLVKTEMIESLVTNARQFPQFERWIWAPLVGGKKLVKDQEGIFTTEMELSNKPKAYMGSVNAAHVEAKENNAYVD